MTDDCMGKFLVKQKKYIILLLLLLYLTAYKMHFFFL